MHISGENEGLIMIVMDECSKSSLCNDSEERGGSKWTITWLQMNKQSRNPLRMIIALRYLMKMEDVLRGSGVRMESSGRFTFYHNMTKNGPKSHSGWSFEFVRSVEIWRYKQVGGHNARGVQPTHGQRYVRIDQPSKGSQECRIQIGVQFEEGCIEWNC